MKNAVFWDVTLCGSLGTDVSEELSASFIVTRIDELGTTLALTSNRRTRGRNTKWYSYILSPGLVEPHSCGPNK
jgi:hypothetical protein